MIYKINLEQLIGFYRHNCRDLPWRKSKNPYEIWVSEIILQQTQVSQGTDYFMTFVRYFPDVKSLANADKDVLMKVWQGLGYYSRAINMQIAAQEIEAKHNGKFPGNYDAIRALKGVGDYTAAAVASIAFQLPYAAVDGNVKRVMARFLGISEPIDDAKTVNYIREFLNREILAFDPGEFNQALMELGATLCRPKKPKCELCPMAEGCVAYQTGRQSLLPVKRPKKKATEMFINFYFVETGGETWLRCRDHKSIWKGLYEFWNTEAESAQTQVPSKLIEGLERPEGAVVRSVRQFTHKLTHRTIYAQFWHISGKPSNIVRETNNLVKVPLTKLVEYPVHRLMHRYLEEMQLV